MADIINEDGGWVVDRISTRIPDDTLKKIYLYKLSVNSHSGDKMNWKGNANGVMMARSFYRFLMKDEETRSTRKWKWV